MDLSSPDIPTRLATALADRYRFERELGQGGMATVYLAEDLRHGRKVAIKVLWEDVSAALVAERFLREVRLAARLNHPNILPVFDSGAAEGYLFYVMPAVEGQSLRDRLARERKLPVAEAVRLATEIARALDYAHRQGIIHRDIKPENILLQDGHAVIADFGIGKALSAVEETATLTGVTIGTPAYMSPEQAAGDEVDGRTDLFALGCVLYESLTGEQPFTGSTAQSVITKRFFHTPSPVMELEPNVPKAVAHTVERLLETSRDQRFPSGASVARALQTPGDDAAPRVPEKSVAVLPFKNMSSDDENEFFSDGITDDIIVALAHIGGLKVAARTSAFSFKGKSAELTEIGRQLGVRTVLQGSVRRAGKRVRVTVQLMSARDGTQLWSERFDRELNDIFAIQDEIVRATVDQLRATLGLAPQPAQLVMRPTDDLEAYELYLRGREAAHQRTPTSLRRAIEFFRQALARDDRYARAYVGLAEAHIGLGVYQYIPTIEAAREAEAALEVATRLDPDLALVHVLWAQLKLYLRADWHTAGADLDAALEREPDNALAHGYVAFLNGMLGRLDASRAAAARAIAADPLSPFLSAIAVMGFPRDGIAGCDAHAALATHEAALAKDPNSMINVWMSGIRLGEVGRYEEAVERMARSVELTRSAPLMIGLHSRALAMDGRREEAIALRDVLRERARSEYVGPAAMLMMLVLDLEDEAAAAVLLQANVDAMTGPTALYTTVSTELRPLLEHPRLAAVVQRMTLYEGGRAVGR